jgi:hypothetical protein
MHYNSAAPHKGERLTWQPAHKGFIGLESSLPRVQLCGVLADWFGKSAELASGSETQAKEKGSEVAGASLLDRAI